MASQLKIFIIIGFGIFFFGCSSTMQILTGAGYLKGVVVDRTTFEPLIGANVVIRETRFGGVADLNGRYLIKGIPPGEYEVIFSMVGYKMLNKKVRIYSWRTTILNVELEPNVELKRERKDEGFSEFTMMFKKPTKSPEAPKERVNEAKPKSNENEIDELSSPLDFIYVTSPFGESRGGRKHLGSDFLADCGDPVYAIQRGVVTFAGYNGGYGLMIEIKHSENFRSIYAHLSKIYVRVGEFVRRDHVIGEVGNTGYATGCHLHLEIIINDNRVDPIKFLKRFSKE